ncbi:MAG TPA: hypothetical protein VMB50_07205, partial [Myxococcales bacterium]|nr:hypothetical protein [Myxococcales bacterium]
MAADWQVRGTQPSWPPQTLGWPPPPQVSGAWQLPHWRTPLQPSPMGPQLAPTEAQLRRPQPPSLGPPVEPPPPVLLPPPVVMPPLVEPPLPLPPDDELLPGGVAPPQWQAGADSPAASRASRGSGRRGRDVGGAPATDCHTTDRLRTREQAE